MHVLNNAFLSEVYKSHSCQRGPTLEGERNHKIEESRSSGTWGGQISNRRRVGRGRAIGHTGLRMRMNREVLRFFCCARKKEMEERSRYSGGQRKLPPTTPYSEALVVLLGLGYTPPPQPPRLVCNTVI